MQKVGPHAARIHFLICRKGPGMHLLESELLPALQTAADQSRENLQTGRMRIAVVALVNCQRPLVCRQGSLEIVALAESIAKNNRIFGNLLALRIPVILVG